MNNIELYSPVKEAKMWGWQHELKALYDFDRSVTQRFGENKLPLYKELGLTGHNGIDIPFNDGTEIYASHDGIIKFAGVDGAGGIGVDVWNKPLRFFTRYWHLRNYIVEEKQPVRAGQIIAYGDSTGKSTGPHLHWGFKRTDAAGNTINKDNGFWGAEDPRPLMRWFKMDSLLTKRDVLMLQALEGYSDAKGAKYWSGKPLRAYLEVRATDKVKELQRALKNSG